MANGPKNPGGQNPGKAGALPFEEALKKLQSIVESMESEDLALETMLSRYEEGTRLARQCQEKLAEAELKIQQLEKSSDGEFSLKSIPRSGAEE